VTIPTDALRQIAAELLACRGDVRAAREKRDIALAAFDAAVAERDAARAEVEQARRDGQEQTAGLHEKLAEVRAEAEKLRDEVTQLEGMERQRDEAYATLDDVCKALGADVDSAVAQALMFKEKAGELAAVKRQRDELVAAVLPVLEKIEPKPSPFQPLLLALVAAVKAAEQPKPQGEGGGA